MIVKMLVTNIKYQDHIEGHRVMEEIEMHSIDGFKPTAIVRIRLTDVEHFGKYELHQQVDMQI